MLQIKRIFSSNSKETIYLERIGSLLFPRNLEEEYCKKIANAASKQIKKVKTKLLESFKISWTDAAKKINNL